MNIHIGRWSVTTLTGGVLSLVLASTALATDPSTTLTISGRVVSKTCSFDKDTQTVVLDDITAAEFIDTGIKKATTFDVGITCGVGVSSVNIIPVGDAASNDIDFLNTGKATGVALRLQDASGNPLRSDGNSSVSVTPVGLTGSYTFTAGYVATNPGGVTGGNFSSSVTLNFDYD